MANIDYSIKDLERFVTGIDGKIKQIDISRLTAPGENYLSLVLRVDFEVEKDGKTKTVNAVAKRLPPVRNKFEFNAIAMKNEIRWYQEIVPLIKEFGKESGIATDYFPDHLGSRLSLDPSKTDADEESALILRNLISEGYKNEDRFLGFDLITTKAVLRVLATYHATPLVIRYKKRELFKILKEYFDSSPPPTPGGKDGPHGAGGKSGPPGGGPPDGNHPPHGKIFDLILDIPNCQPYKEKIEAVKQKPSSPFKLGSRGPEPWNTVTHNDFWVNNIMVKHREGDEPLVKVVDFQACTYSSFAKDLVFFLLSSVRNDVQREHFDDLLRYYYDEFTSFFKKRDIPELKLSYENYLEEVKRVALESETLHAIFFSTIIFGARGGPDVLSGEVDMFEHMKYMMNNIGSEQKEKLGTMTELAVTRGWM